MSLKSYAKKAENIYADMENAIKSDLINALIVKQYESRASSLILNSLRGL